MRFSITTVYHYAECFHAECRILFIVMPNVIMLSVGMLGAVMLSVVAPKADIHQTSNDNITIIFKEVARYLQRTGLKRLHHSYNKAPLANETTHIA